MTTRRRGTHGGPGRGIAGRWRTLLTAALVVMLTAVVPGVSWAAWTASDSATSTAKAASVGITQAVSGSTLNTFSYSTATPRAVATVTVTNTSTRAGSYTLGVSAVAAAGTANATAFLTAVSVEIGTTGSCTTSATLGSPTTGTLATTTTYTGTLAAGASVVLCVRTTMTSAGITAHAGKALTGTIASGIQVGTWTASATAATFAQSVAAAPTEVFFVNSAPRYNIRNDNVCVSVYDSYQNKVARGGICDFNNLGQFRITNLGGGVFTISAARNATSQPEAPRWSVSSATANIVTAVAQNVDNQRWRILQRPDGTYRIESVAFPGYCATVSNVHLWSNNPELVTTACDPANTLATQGFTFSMIGNPIPTTPHPITCTNAGWALLLNWPFDPLYRQEIAYRMLVNGVVVAPNYLNSHNAESHLTASAVANAGIAAGTGLPLVIEYRLDGSAWAPIAARTINYAGGNLTCG